MNRSNKNFFFKLYKSITANTSVIWQHAAHTTDQLTSPNCYDNTQPYRTGRRPGQQGPRLPPYTRTEVSSVLLVHQRRFEEETTPPSELGTQGH